MSLYLIILRNDVTASRWTFTQLVIYVSCCAWLEQLNSMTHRVLYGQDLKVRHEGCMVT